MAESAVSFFLNKLSFLIDEEVKLLGGLETQVVSLRDELEWIRYFLKDAEKKRKEYQMVEVWMRQIRDLAYEAEDVIDAFILQVEQQHKKNIVFKIISYWSQLKDRHKIGKWIEQINRRTKEISDCRFKYNLQLESKQDSENRPWKKRDIVTVEELMDIKMFQDEADEVANRWLINQNETQRQRQVICIIGEGGMSYSTRTRLIYDRADIKKYFEVRAWIDVSQEYQVKDLLLSALQQVSSRKKYEPHELTTDYLERELQKHLQDKTYLVVVDDVWKTEAWDEIVAFFPQNQKGSRIILTTCINKVASHASPSTNQRKLKYMDEDASLELFCRKVFPPSGKCPDEFLKEAKEIVKTCNGLPLAIVGIGGLLIGNKERADAWSKVRANVNWQLTQDSNIPCREILALSYTDLPYYLKSCFLYLGLFPEDFEIKANRLIRLWVAEGFVRARGEDKMEDVAEDYLNDLIQRSMIQVVKKKYQGGPVETCTVNSIWRGLAISEAKNDRFLDIHGKKDNSTSGMIRSRRLAIHPIDTNQNAHHFSSHKLRSLLIYYADFEISKCKLEFGESTKMLRVLELEGVHLLEKNLPIEIGKLILLHYLGLSNTGLQRLPTSIGKLIKLQTLDIRGTNVRSVPQAIWKLQQLRHLFLKTSYMKQFQKVRASREDLPKHLLTLHLPSFIWMDMGEGLANHFVEFDCLRSLRLYEKLALVNDNLQSCWLPSSLTELNLKSCQLERDPSAMLGSLPKLRELGLGESSYVGREMVFSAKGFAQLRFLKLSELKKFEEWRVEDGAMPKLKHLLISGCGMLKMLPNELQNINSLKRIELFGMSERYKNKPTIIIENKPITSFIENESITIPIND